MKRRWLVRVRPIVPQWDTRHVETTHSKHYTRWGALLRCRQMRVLLGEFFNYRVEVED